MELSGKTLYGPVLKTTQLSARAQSDASPERCRKSFTIIFLSDHDFPLTASKFGNLTAFMAILAQYRRVTDGQTDGRTDGIAVASTALAVRALRRAVKTKTIM